MARTCAVHSSEPAAGQCSQCQKPVCKSCVMITPHGTFCSTECNVVYREFKQKNMGEKKKSRLGTKLAFFFLLIVAAFLGIHIAVRAGVESLRSVDLLGKVFPSEPKKPSP